ncbi:uncharacterized protein LOC106131732 [Amyelois transitella]|uniref:uncharacterized protein LOC106131732 n=1 Tax=Amyelois transitella TaxID=680683 RepID=UPI00067BE34C|nr:uncharacterized protein LOC106131732 [Amyelois transitella]
MSLDVNISEPDEFNCIELHSVLKDVAKIKGIDDFNYHVDSIGGKGESYIANTFRVIVRDNVDEDNKFTVVVKTLVNTGKREIFHELHKREASVYKDIIPIFNEIQAKVLDDKVVLPECVLSCDENGKEVLILEDLQHEGWLSNSTLKNFDELNYKTVKLVITELAKLHALSYVFEQRYPEKFCKLKEQFEDIIFQDKFLNKSKLRSYFQDSYDASLNLVTDDDARKSLGVIGSKLLDILRGFTKPHEHSVFCHGDCWINNMLFKFEENEATAVCFLDFQTVRHSSPVTDIIHFLYLCTSPQFRSEFFETLKTDYYEKLKSTLIAFETDINTVYPAKDFENDLEVAKQYGLLIAMIDLKIVFLTPEEDAILNGANVSEEVNLTKVPGEEELLKIKLNAVVQEAIENGVIEQLYKRVINCDI